MVYKARDLNLPSRCITHASTTNFGGRNNLQPACSKVSLMSFHGLSLPHPQRDSCSVNLPNSLNRVDEMTNPSALHCSVSFPEFSLALPSSLFSSIYSDSPRAFGLLDNCRVLPVLPFHLFHVFRIDASLSVFILLLRDLDVPCGRQFVRLYIILYTSVL